MNTSESDRKDLIKALLTALPSDGSRISNISARIEMSLAAGRLIGEEEYLYVKTEAVELGLVTKGGGRGGTIGLAQQQEDTRSVDTLSTERTNNKQREETNTTRKGGNQNKQNYNSELLDYLTDMCGKLAGLQKTLRYFPEFQEEEIMTLELCMSLRSKLTNCADPKNEAKLNDMFYG